MNESLNLEITVNSLQYDSFIETANKEIAKFEDSLSRLGVEKKRKNTLMAPEDIPTTWLNVNK